MTKCVTLRVAKTDIQRLLHERPEFAQSFILLVLARKARVEEDLLDQLFNSTERRLARVLLLLANIGKEGGPESTAMQVSQEVLAKMIGATRSQVSHFMNKFRRLGLIEYNGNIQVHSSLQSTILNGMPDGA